MSKGKERHSLLERWYLYLMEGMCRNNREMEQTQFIKRYCKNSGIAEQELNPLGLFAVPCDCGEENCDGWAMITRENLKAHCDLYIDNPKSFFNPQGKEVTK